MSNSFYSYSGAFIPGTLARAEAVAAEYTLVQAGFALLDHQGTDSGAVNAYVVTTNGAPTTAYADGQIVWFKPLTGNSGAATINVNGLGVVSIKTIQGSTLASGQMPTNAWCTLYYNSSFSAWTLIAPNAGVVAVGTVSAAAPTNKVGLTAAGGVATSAAPIDATYAIDQGIAPTWTSKHIFSGEIDVNGVAIFGAAGSATFNSNVVIAAPSAGVALAVSGRTAQWAQTIAGAASGTSRGLLINSGLTSADYCQLWQNAGATLAYMALWGDGGLTLGTPTGGDKGAGAMNATALYINGVAVTAGAFPSVPSGANPTASVGLLTVNGSAATFMRSDGAPAIDQTIIPTWTGAHNFTGGLSISGVAAGYLDTPANPQTGDYTLALTDRGKGVNKLSGSTATWTIPANGSVAFPVGTTIVLSNGNGGAAITLAITTDTLYWEPTGATGSRTLAVNALATLYKNSSTTWQIAGVGIT